MRILVLLCLIGPFAYGAEPIYFPASAKLGPGGVYMSRFVDGQLSEAKRVIPIETAGSTTLSQDKKLPTT